MTKRELWLYHYLNQENPTTYLKAGPSARAAGYECSDDNSFYPIGCANKRHYMKQIEEWLVQEGLSTNTLKLKLLELMGAKTTRYFTHMGVVTDSRDVKALDIQARALNMALKVNGSYAPEKQEISGPGGGPIATASITTEMSPKEAASLYQRLIKGD
jgi:hypothetical protein